MFARDLVRTFFYFIRFTLIILSYFIIFCKFINLITVLRKCYNSHKDFKTSTVFAMATYKVIQDIEAEDKFLGPLTLKQFVFGAGGAFFGYLNVFALQQNFPYAMIILVPPMLLGFFLAIPWSKDQPTEVWVLAKLRFYFKPRNRIWDQSGMEELVTITAPKKEEKPLTKNFTQTEVKSRLEALAQTIDSRGWAIKDVGGIPSYQPVENSDRLISPAVLPQEVPIIDTASIPDVYAGETSTSANFDRMIEQSTELRKAQSLEKMDRIRHGEPLESISIPEVHFTPPQAENYQPFAQAPNQIDEESLTKELKNRRAPDSFATAHMRKIKPMATTPTNTASTDDSAQPTTAQNSGQADDPSAQSPQDDTTTTQQIPPTSPGILEYAGNNDLNVATIARQAKKDTEGNSDEVVVSLR